MVYADSPSARIRAASLFIARCPVPEFGAALHSRVECGFGFRSRERKGTVMDEILARLWHNITARLTGPMHLRLIVQPTVAAILAIRAGLRDARQDRPPFLSTLLRNPAHRRELLRRGWKDVGKVFLIAAILDVIYQLIVHRGVYLLELLLTAVTLAIVPYVLLRGPVSRIARLVFGAPPAIKQPPI